MNWMVVGVCGVVMEIGTDAWGLLVLWVGGLYACSAGLGRDRRRSRCTTTVHVQDQFDGVMERCCHDFLVLVVLNHPCIVRLHEGDSVHTEHLKM